MTRRLGPILLAILALSLTACGEKDEHTAPGAAQDIDLVLDFLPNADHAGIYAAQARGDFAKFRVDVDLRTPSDPAAPLKLLASGRADLAISYEPELLLARAKGAKLVSIAALVQKPLTSVMSLGPDAIERASELRGKRVGTAGIPYQDAYLKQILAEANVPESSVETIDVGFNLSQTMLSKRVDATLGAFWNVEGVDLERRRRDPTILKVDQLGVPTYNELVVVAREQDVRSRGAVLRRFLQALTAGHEAVRDDPDVGVDALLDAEPGLKRDLTRRQVQATLPVFFPESRQRPFGFHDRFEWRRYTTWMLDNDLLDAPTDSERAFTNEFLPGEGV